MSGLLCLKWNNHSPAFLKHLSKLRIKELFCDATIVCNNKFFSVHKFVLSTCSEYFEEIFEKTQCKHPFIIVKDIQSSELEALLDYMYKGEVNVLQELLPGIIKAAECLKVKGLAVPEENEEDSSQSTSRKTKRDKRNAHGSPVPHKRFRQSDASILERHERLQIHESDILQLQEESDKVCSNNCKAGIQNEDSNSDFNSELNQSVATNIKLEPNDNSEALCESKAAETADEYSFNKKNYNLKDERLSQSDNIEDFGVLGLSTTNTLDEPQCSSWKGLTQAEGGGDSNARLEEFQDEILGDVNHFSPSNMIGGNFPECKNVTNLKKSKGKETIPANRHLLNCEHCSYTTGYLTTLKRHVLSWHGGVKPFKCPDCSFQTVQKWHLLRHKASHNVLSCQHCEFQTRFKKKLAIHLRKNH